SVLVLGGGDGLAVREILKYPGVEKITLVDLDPEMTKLFSTNPMLTALNGNSLAASKLHIVNADAFLWLAENRVVFDFVRVDFPNDMLPVDVEPNRLNDQVLVRYYEREWREIAH